MKFLVVFGVIALTAAAPQQRKLFHEHFEDFLDIIMEDAGDALEHVYDHYKDFEGFRAPMDYIATQNFKELIYELEALPEFKAVIEFLENDNIDITYFLNRFNDMIENVNFDSSLQARHTISGTDFSSFVKDCISEFPQAKLAALFEQKMAEDDTFRVAMDNLNSDEWAQTYGALWENETFLKEMKILEENGIDLNVFLQQILAVFGQA